jgi:hypothetical protein
LRTEIHSHARTVRQQRLVVFDGHELGHTRLHAILFFGPLNALLSLPTERQLRRLLRLRAPPQTLHAVAQLGVRGFGAPLSDRAEDHPADGCDDPDERDAYDSFDSAHDFFLGRHRCEPSEYGLTVRNAEPARG